MRKLVMLPGPTNVPDRVMQAMTQPIINHRGGEFRGLYKRMVEKAKTIFSTAGDIVVLSSSGTGGVEAAVTNIVRSRDKVLVPVFGEFSERLAQLVESRGGEAIVISSPYGSGPRIEEIEEELAKHKDLKAIFIVYNETSTGARFAWIKKLGELASQHGVFFVVDAISNFGGDEMLVDKFGVDICITGSQKCLAAPPGLALLSVSERVKRYLRESPPENQYFNIARYIEYGERGETPYTPNLPVFYALDEAFTIILEEGLAVRIQRHKRCSEAFYQAFEAMGLKPFCRKDVRSITVIAMNYPDGIDDTEFRKVLEGEYRVLLAGGFGQLKGKIFRVGCMGEVEGYHVYTTVFSVSSALNTLGFDNKFEAAQLACSKILPTSNPLSNDGR